MGHFLAVTAIRTESVSDVTKAIAEYMGSHDVNCASMPADTPPESSTDAVLFHPVDGWVAVLWPAYFNLHDFPLVRSIVASHGWLASTVHVYDGDYWEHLAVRGDAELHSFCSRPGYWADDPDEHARIASLSPNPEALCAALARPAASVARYLIDVDSLSDEEERAHAEDEFELGDYWVFVDFWRHLGITYPDPGSNCALVLRLSRRFGDRLPCG